MHSTGVFTSLLFAAALAVAAPAVEPRFKHENGTDSTVAYPTDTPSRSGSSSAAWPHKPTVASEPPYTVTLSPSKVPSYTPDSPYVPDSPYTPDSPYKGPGKTASPDAPAPKPTPPQGSKPGDWGEGKPFDEAAFEAGLPPVVPVNTRSGDRALIADLLTAPTQQDRVRLLNKAGDYVFDFNEGAAPQGSQSVGKGGHTTSANARTFPALIGNDAAMTLGFLGPCGMNTAHVHNRATELNIVVEGRLVTNFFIENGVPSIANTLSKYQMTVFPQGAIHQEFNPDCTDAVFVAGFNNADPGVEQVAQSFFGLRPDVVASTLGGVYSINGADLETFRDHIPANVALGVEQCLQKCGIKKNAKRELHEALMM